ncbi:MAG TPA: hypothetical protein VF747_17750, partial [Blastocatellia bacterium]
VDLRDMVRCEMCGTALSDLNELHSACPSSGADGKRHEVSSRNYFVLYGKTGSNSTTHVSK